MVSNIFYRLVSFADYKNIGYSPNILSSLIDLFGTDYSINPVPELVSTGTSYVGINMTSKNPASPTIIISSMRIEIAMASDKKTGFNEEEIEKVKRTLNGFLIQILNRFSVLLQDANRLSWIVNYAYFDIDIPKMNEFKNKFLLPLAYYNTKSTTEFVAKYAGVDFVDINGREEKANVISTIYRWFPSQGAGFVNAVNGFGLELDINTIAENRKSRFSPNDIGYFILAADSIKTRIVGEVFNECE